MQPWYTERKTPHTNSSTRVLLLLKKKIKKKEGTKITTGGIYSVLG